MKNINKYKDIATYELYWPRSQIWQLFPQMKKCINLGSWTGVGLLIVQIEMNGPNEGFFQLEKDAFFSQQFRPQIYFAMSIKY